MTTAPATLVALQRRLVAELHTTNLGIVGDDKHVASGGYHIGAASLRAHGKSSDYSLRYPIDSNAGHDYACAIDIGGSAELLMSIGNNLVHALKNHDPRVYGRIRATNAPFDGVGIDRRYDTNNPNTSADDGTQANSDRNHVHIEFYRTLVLDSSVTNDLFDVLAGGHVTTSPPPVVVTPPPPPPPPVKWGQGLPVPALIRKGSGQYLGLITGPNASHGGHNASERPIIAQLQTRLNACGYNPGGADGLFGPNTANAVSAFQHQHMPGTKFFGQCWWDDWTKLFNL